MFGHTTSLTRLFTERGTFAGYHVYGTKYRNDHTGRLSWFISAFDGHGQELSYWVQGERSHEVAMHMTVNRSYDSPIQTFARVDAIDPVQTAMILAAIAQWSLLHTQHDGVQTPPSSREDSILEFTG